MLMFSMKGHASMAANGNIADPVFVFFKMFFFPPDMRDRSALT